MKTEQRPGQREWERKEKDPSKQGGFEKGGSFDKDRSGTQNPGEKKGGGQQ